MLKNRQMDKKYLALKMFAIYKLKKYVFGTQNALLKGLRGVALKNILVLYSVKARHS